MSESVPVRYPAIQGLRAVAALMVVGAHAKIAVEVELLRIPIPDLPLSPFPLVAGVDVFFVVSGFVMAHASQTLFGRVGAWRLFLWRRLARIVPLYWVVTTALLALMVAIHSPILRETSNWQVAAAFLFIPALNPDGFPVPVLDVGWTLNYEMAFYVVFAAFIGLRRSFALWSVAICLVMLAICHPLLASLGVVVRFWSDPIILEFLGGILIQEAVRRGVVFTPWTRALMIAAAVVILAAFPALDFTWRWLQWGGPAMLLVAAAVCGRVRFARWTPAVELAGNISYALYLVHFFAIRAVAQVARRGEWGPEPHTIVVFVVLIMGVAVGMAWALHLAAERPTLRWLRNREPLFARSAI